MSELRVHAHGPVRTILGPVAMAGLALLHAATTVWSHPSPDGHAGIAALLGGLLLSIVLALRLRARSRARVVRVTPTHLELDGRRIEKSAVYGVSEVHALGRVLVTLLDARDRELLTLTCTDASEADARLAALGVGEAAVRVAGPLRSLRRFALLGALGGLAGGGVGLALGLHGSPMLVAILCAGLPILLREHARVVVGRDAVAATRGWRGRELVPYAQLLRVEERVDSVWLVRDDGSVVDLCLDRGKASAALRSRVARWIESAHARWRQEAARERVGALARGDASVAEWKRALDAHAKASSYRSPGLAREVLVRVATDDGADASSRVGAAQLLSRALADDALREALERSARVSADEDVRDALEGAARDEPERVERAMDAVARRRA